MISAWTDIINVTFILAWTVLLVTPYCACQQSYTYDDSNYFSFTMGLVMVLLYALRVNIYLFIDCILHQEFVGACISLVRVDLTTVSGFVNFAQSAPFLYYIWRCADKNMEQLRSRRHGTVLPTVVTEVEMAAHNHTQPLQVTAAVAAISRNGDHNLSGMNYGSNSGGNYVIASAEILASDAQMKAQMLTYSGEATEN